jgi:hypothetical protein
MTAYLLPFSEKSLSLHKQRRKTMPGSSTEAVALYPPSAGFFFQDEKDILTYVSKVPLIRG